MSNNNNTNTSENIIQWNDSATNSDECSLCGGTDEVGLNGCDCEDVLICKHCDVDGVNYDGWCKCGDCDEEEECVQCGECPGIYKCVPCGRSFCGDMEHNGCWKLQRVMWSDGKSEKEVFEIDKKYPDGVCINCVC